MSIQNDEEPILFDCVLRRHDLQGHVTLLSAEVPDRKVSLLQPNVDRFWPLL